VARKKPRSLLIGFVVSSFILWLLVILMEEPKVIVQKAVETDGLCLANDTCDDAE
jgi:hypothetical protein